MASGGVLQSSKLFYIRGDAAQLGPAKPNAIWRVPALQFLQTLSAQYVLAKGLTETVHSVLFDHPASIETVPTYRLEAQLLYERGASLAIVFNRTGPISLPICLCR